MRMRTRLERLETQLTKGAAEIRPLFIVDDMANVCPDAPIQIPEDETIRGLAVEHAGQQPITFWRQPGETLAELRMRGAGELRRQSPGHTLPFEMAIPIRDGECL